MIFSEERWKAHDIWPPSPLGKRGNRERMHAAEVCLNRTYGQAQQSVKLDFTPESPWEKAGVERAIILRNAIDVESEEWDNPYEDEPTKAAREKADRLTAARARALPPPPPAVADDPFEDEEDNPFEDTANPVVKGRPTRRD